jgi:UrcA family protein
MQQHRFALSGRLALAMLGAVASLAVAGPSLAQDEDDIVVTPPYNVHRQTTGRSAAGARIESVSVSRVVTTEGLDLRYDADVSELNRRISYAAADVCDYAGDLLRIVSATSDRDCVRAAIRGARPQVRDVVARARS